MPSKAKRTAVASTIKLSFNTDFDACHEKAGCGLLGPDGPWQAPFVRVGGDGGPKLPLYPSLFYGSSILTIEGGGLYDPAKSSAARKMELLALDNAELDGSMDSFINQTSSTVASYFDSIQLVSTSSGAIDINTTLFAASDWKCKTANGSSYAPWVGYLGLAKYDLVLGDEVPPGVLDQVKSQGIIGTKTASMNLASAKHQQSGSFVLGGYDKSRAIGPLGIWPRIPAQVMLRDVTLVVEEGGSPFKSDTSITKDTPLSIWQGLGDSKLGINITRSEGGADGSAVVTPMATLPSIYLPLGNCEAAAKHLPVTWRDDIGYYTWNVDDAWYKRIVSSPAYMGFVLSTPDAKNVTIKVAFALLNLTLESPIVSAPTQYFPCHPVDAEHGRWILGRAFLQAAFWGLDYDNHQMYIGQGPGPRQEQALVKAWPTGNNTLETSPEDSYASTWRTHWTALPEDSQKSTKGSRHGLSGGAIAGIVMGIVVCLAILTGAAWWLMRKRRNATREKNSSDARTDDKETVTGVPSQCHESSKDAMPAEVMGVEQRHELGG